VPGSDLRVTVEDGLSRPTEAAWDDLCSRVGAVPFFRPGWIEAWRRAFGQGRLLVLSVWRGRDLAAALPLEGRGRVLRGPANWHTPVFGLVADTPDAASRVVAAVLELGPQQLDLGFVDRGSITDEALRAAAASSEYRVESRVRERSPFVTLDRGWDDYLATLGRSFRSELRRRWRRLGEAGSVELEVADGTEGFDARFDEGLAIEASGWKGERGTAIASHSFTAGFYRPVARWAAARGWLRLAFLRLDGRAIAFDLSFEDDGVHALLKTGYDPEFNPFSPGSLLRREMLNRSFSLGHHSYEFLGNDEPWKLSWTEAARERLLLQAFAPSAPGRARGLVHMRGRQLAKKVLASIGRPR
jgi:CelD/BcsL family acetyltransferase involved in cellulose biosynthesis